MATTATRVIVLLLSLLLALQATASRGSFGIRGNGDSGRCGLDQLSASEPSQKIESEGGITELWDEEEDQFQCAGVAAMRNTIRPNSLSLPNYHPYPRLVFIQKGRGLLGLSFPGCPETYQYEEEEVEEPSVEGHGSSPQGGGKKQKRRDRHQKVHRIQEGEIVLIPAGATHFCINDDTDKDLVAVSVTDLRNSANQLGRQFRQFYLAGAVSEKNSRGAFLNLLQGLDEEMLAEAFNVPVDVVKKMQKRDVDRGLIVKLGDGWSLAGPGQGSDDDEGEASFAVAANYHQSQLHRSMCKAKINQNINNPRSAYIYGRNTGSLTVADANTLPILQTADLSAERLKLFPGALFAPHYSMYSHTIVYVTSGEAQVQVSGTNGKPALDQKVSPGEMFVVPQDAIMMVKAGKEGYESVAFKTTGQPERSPLAGYASVMRGLPLSVLQNAYDISADQARSLKKNRRRETLLLSPTRRGQY